MREKSNIMPILLLTKGRTNQPIKPKMKET